MKSILSIFLLFFILQSCTKNKIEHTLFTNVWDLTIVVGEDSPHDPVRRIEYFNPDGMLVERRGIFRDGDEYHLQIIYNENKQISELASNDTVYCKYYYDGDFLIKKDYISDEGIISMYLKYEYSNNLIDKIKSYSEQGNLLIIEYFFYTTNRPDSTYKCLVNQTDSIIEIKRFLYDDLNNTVEEEYWHNGSYPEILLKFVYRKLTKYDDEDRISRIEYSDIDNNLNDIIKYHYDQYGKFIKKEFYLYDELLGIIQQIIPMKIKITSLFRKYLNPLTFSLVFRQKNIFFKMKHWYEKLFENYGIGYDNESFTKGTTGECDFIEKEIEYNKQFRILDIGCGTGRHSIELTKRGYNITGVDLSTGMLERAKAKAAKEGLNIDFQKQDARNLGFENEFDLTIMLCEGAFPLMETDEMNFQILQNASKSLKSDGKLIFTTLNGLFPLFHSVKEFLENAAKNDMASHDDHSFDLMSFRDINKVKLTDDSEKEIEADCNERYYVPPEITWLLKSVGFKKINIYGATLGAFSREDKLTTEDFEMLVIAEF